MLPHQFYSILKNKFPFQPTLKQNVFFQMISEFLTDKNDEQIFVLKGYAGTGKTTVISTIVNSLNDINMKAVLLAPTGRAAKVIANYSNKPAFTIHKRIYFPKKGKGGGVSFTTQANKFKNTIFIVDEASMISDVAADSKLYENGSLLDDLIFYIYNGQNCKMILLGDTAQLPPVQMEVSPALDTDSLALHYDKTVLSIELDEVMRQEEKSGILYNATQLRELLKETFLTDIQFKVKGFKTFVERYLIFQDENRYAKISVKYNNQIVTTLNSGFKGADSLTTYVKTQNTPALAPVSKTKTATPTAAKPETKTTKPGAKTPVSVKSKETTKTKEVKKIPEKKASQKSNNKK